MPLTITCTDGGTSVSSTLSDDLVSSIDQYRLTLGAIQGAGFVVTYPDIPSMFAGVVNATIVIPALKAFPTPGIQTAQQAFNTAQAALTAAQNAEIPAMAPVS